MTQLLHLVDPGVHRITVDRLCLVVSASKTAAVVGTMDNPMTASHDWPYPADEIFYYFRVAAAHPNEPFDVTRIVVAGTFQSRPPAAGGTLPPGGGGQVEQVVVFSRGVGLLWE